METGEQQPVFWPLHHHRLPLHSLLSHLVCPWYTPCTVAPCSRHWEGGHGWVSRGYCSSWNQVSAKEDGQAHWKSSMDIQTSTGALFTQNHLHLSLSTRTFKWHFQLLETLNILILPLFFTRVIIKFVAKSKHFWADCSLKCFFLLRQDFH